MAPPDSPDAAARSGWPMVVGVIAIIFGALGLLASCANVGFLLFVEPLADAMADVSGQTADAFGLAGVMEWRTWIMVAAGVSALIALPLLLGGIAVSRRRASCRSILLTWAIVKIVFVPASAVIAFLANESQYEATKDNPMTAGMSAEVSRIMGDAITGLGIPWGWALPVFLLIWFNRRKIKDDMATWSDAGDALPR